MRLLTTPVSPADSTTQGWPVLCPLPLLPTGVRAQATPEEGKSRLAVPRRARQGGKGTCRPSPGSPRPPPTDTHSSDDAATWTLESTSHHPPRVLSTVPPAGLLLAPGHPGLAGLPRAMECSWGGSQSPHELWGSHSVPRRHDGASSFPLHPGEGEGEGRA